MVDNKKTRSEFIEEKKSGIHNKGIFAKKFIPKGTQIIEYVGELISKDEADKRADLVLNESKNHKERGAVYIFELNKKFDLDGNVPYNTARFINHSCNPNCESENIDEKIWITAIKDINKGEEITYNYGYDVDNFEEHPCFCGSVNCVGYIVEEDQRVKLSKILKKNFNNKKVLVAYYSRSGITKRVAEYLSRSFGFDLDEISSGSRKGLFGYVKSGYESASNKKPRIFFNKNPDDYDLVIVGTPVWAGTVSSPVRSYLDFCKNVDVAAFSTLGGNNSGKTFKEISLSVPFFKGMVHIKSSVVIENKFQSDLLSFFKDIKL